MNAPPRLDDVRAAAEQAETALLGALLIGGDVDGCAALVDGDLDAWSREAHQLVWQAIVDVHATGAVPDTLAVLDRLRRGGHVDTIGGPVVLPDLAAAAPAPSQAVLWAEKVAEAAQRRRAYRAAHRLLRDVQDPSVDPWEALQTVQEVAEASPSVSAVPPLRPLGEFLAEPDPEVTFRVEGLWPAYGNALLAAQYKAGKSTTVGNVLRCLADGDPLYGRYQVNRPRGRVALIDDELHEATLRRWLRDQGIRNVDAIHVAPLKGRVGTFDVFSSRGRAAWAAELRRNDVSVLVVDCLRPILDAHGMDENHEMGRLLVALETLVADAGADELLCIHHMGHSGERSRGDSRLRDWPDVEWKLVRQSDDASSPRFFSAYGRDVDEPEQQLHLDPDTRRLTIIGGSRREQVLDDLMTIVCDVVTAAPGAGARDIREQVRDEAGEATNGDIDSARRRAVDKGLIRVDREGSKHAHYPTVPSVPDRAGDVPARLPAECAGVPIGTGTHKATTAAQSDRAEPRHGTPCEVCGSTVNVQAEPDGTPKCPEHHRPWPAQEVAS